MQAHTAQPCWRRARTNKTEINNYCTGEQAAACSSICYSLCYVILLNYLWACLKCRKDKGDPMFRKFKDDPYFRAGAAVVISGAILILFYAWVSNTKFSIGFQTLNSTLIPFYIGIIFAFILCPVYNACVKKIYSHMVTAASRKGFSVGPTLHMEEEGSLPVDNAERRKCLNIARIVASLICVIIVVGVVALFIYFVLPTFISSLINLVYTFPQRMASLSTWLDTHFTHFPGLAEWVDKIANTGTGEMVDWMEEHILGSASDIAVAISSGVATAVSVVIKAVVGLLIMIYLLNYKETLFAITRKIVSATCGQKRQEGLYEFAAIVNETFIGFIVGRIIDSFIIGVLTFIVTSIFHIPFALMISVIIGVTNVIPFFGPFIGAVPSVVILLLENPMSALYMIVIIIVIQQLDGNVIGPKVVGNAIGISSFWVLVAVLIGGGLFGFMGMLFGVPVFAVIYRYVNKITSKSLDRKNKPSATDDYLNYEPYGLTVEEIAVEEKEKKKKEKKYLFRKGKDSEK